MENASKALLIAGEVLIAMLVASMFALLFSTMSEYSKNYDIERQTQELEAFNTDFLQYAEKATAQDIITATKKAEAWNEKNEYNPGDNGYITVTCDGNTLNGDPDKQNKLLWDNGNYGTEYDATSRQHVVVKRNATIEYDNTTGRINRIEYH